MKLSRVFLFAFAGIVFLTAGLFAAVIKSTNETVTTPSVYVPDTSHASDVLTDNIFAWDSVNRETNAPADTATAHFVFNFTNVATVTNITFSTNAANVTAVTNITPASVTILSVHPSCSCTTAELPPMPWTIPPGESHQIGVNVDLRGKIGSFFKFVDVSTDKGSKRLNLTITMLPPVIPTLTDADRAQGVMTAKVDRQAVFKNDCAACHAKPAEGKYGKALYDSVCAICHEAERRATMVPDLHALKTATNDDFWRTWIAHGKAGSLMPAFSTAEGGPLSDMQIASLAAYLDQAIPSLVPPQVQ